MQIFTYKDVSVCNVYHMFYDKRSAHSLSSLPLSLLTLTLTLTLTLGVGGRVGVGVSVLLVYLVLEHEVLGRRGLDRLTKYCVLIGPRTS